MTGLLLPNDRLVTDRGERLEAQPKAPARSRLAHLLTTWPFIVPLLVLSVVYGRTVQRSTGNQFSVDTTKFDYLGLVLGTAHPPGYPLYTMLNAAFVRMVPWGSVAFRANLLSAVFAISACLVAVAILTKLGVRRVVAAGGATALGLIPQLWHFALIAEVYTLSILFVALVLACLLAYDSTWRPAWLRAGLLIFAFSFAHATSQVLLIPGLLIYLAVRRPAWLFRPRELARLLPLGAALALLPYAYLVWRTAAGAPLLDTRVTGITSFWEVISGARVHGDPFQQLAQWSGHALAAQRVADLRLPAGTLEEDHHSLRHRKRQLMAVILFDHCQRHVDAGARPGRSPDAVILDEYAIGVDVDAFEALLKLLAIFPVGRGAAPFENARQRKHEGTGTDGGDAPDR